MASGDISTLASTLHRYYGTVTPTATVPLPNPMLGDMYVNKTTQEAYFYSGFGNFNGWSLLRNIVTVTVDPTVTSPSSGDNDIVMYNKTPYMKISGVWTAFAPDIAEMITTALIPVNSNISTLQTSVGINSTNITALQASVAGLSKYAKGNFTSISNQAITSTLTTLAFPTTLLDVNSANSNKSLDQTTFNSYICQIAGDYRINCGLKVNQSITLSTYLKLMVYYNGNFYREIAYESANLSVGILQLSWLIAGNTTIFNCVAGDKIEIKAITGGAVSISLSTDSTSPSYLEIKGQ